MTMHTTGTPQGRMRAVLEGLNTMLPDKVEAYGAAHELQPQLWGILLRQYQQPDGTYRIPAAVLRQIPRVTRVLDRLIRILSATDGVDKLGEDPWRDAAGDCIAGAATTLLEEQAQRVMDGRGSVAWGGDCG